MRKITGHLKLANSNPPIPGPSIFPRATMVPVNPKALPRSASGNMLDTMPMPVAIIILAPKPCSIRMPTSIIRLLERLQPSDPRAKTMNPQVKMRLLPSRSPNRPKKIRVEVITSR